MNRKKLMIPAAAVTAVTAVLGTVLLWGSAAGAKPSDPPVAVETALPDVTGNSNGDVLGNVPAIAFDAWVDDVEASIAALDAKKNEDNTVTRVDEEDADPDANGLVRYCFNQLLPADADYPEPAVSNQPGTETCPAENLTPMPDGPVVKHIDVTAVPGPVPSPYNFQVGHLTTSGAVISVFDINGNRITTPVRFTVEASYTYAPAAAE